MNRKPDFNPFLHDKILDQTKFKAFADDKLNVTTMIISVSDRIEDIVGKGEIALNCGKSRKCLYKQFSFSHNVFKMPLFQTCQKVSLSGNGLDKITMRVALLKEQYTGNHTCICFGKKLWKINDYSKQYLEEIEERINAIHAMTTFEDSLIAFIGTRFP